MPVLTSRPADARNSGSHRTWHMVAVQCVTVPPTHALVSRYLKLHLQKCATEISTPQGKFARYCLRSLTRNWEKKRRKYAPSIHEIKCVIKRRSLRQAVYLLTGEQCEVQLDSAATCQEVIRKVKVMVGMRADAEGFALYEVTTGAGEGAGTSRALACDVRLCDVICRWERSSRQATGLDYRLDFKKRLFLEPYVNLQDPAECELVCHQLIQDVFEERVPLTPQDAAQLCALKIQSEMSHLSTYDVDYSSVMRILPRAMRGRVRVEEVERRQRGIQHLTSHQALVAFLHVLRGWSLFGATLFDVSQTSTTALPKDLSLAVHEKGVTLLETPSLKSLSSFAFWEVQQGSGAVKSVHIVPTTTARGNRIICQSLQGQRGYTESRVREVTQSPGSERSHRVQGQRGHTESRVREVTQSRVTEVTQSPGLERLHSPGSERSHSPGSERSHRVQGQRGHTESRVREVTQSRVTEVTQSPGSERLHSPGSQRLHRVQGHRGYTESRVREVTQSRVRQVTQSRASHSLLTNADDGILADLLLMLSDSQSDGTALDRLPTQANSPRGELSKQGCPLTDGSDQRRQVTSAVRQPVVGQSFGDRAALHPGGDHRSTAGV
ncbi:hypothetical protein ACOMHN_009147 [Nucella lapillus]